MILQRVKVASLDLIRRGDSVAWVPEWMNLGNLLYMGQWAYEGRGRSVLLHESKRASLRIFPALLESLFRSKREISVFDRRVMPWQNTQEQQAAHRDANRDAAYITDLLLSGSGLERSEVLRPGDMVVNVRRGDYYSVQQHFLDFGMDQIAYVDAALTSSVERHGVPRRLVVISDDILWCRENLDGVLRRTAPVEYADGDSRHDLRALVNAERLIIPNSTFSYWGGYIGDVLRPEREVIAPWLFSRSVNAGRAFQLRPHWHVITDGCESNPQHFVGENSEKRTGG